MRDEIMRLADLVSELHVSSDYAHGLKAKIERELRTLARTDHVEDRLGMVPEALKYPNENKFRLIDVFRQEHNFARGWNACRDAMLAAAPAPDQSAGVGGMVSDGWIAPNVLTEEMLEAADDAHVAAYSDPSMPVSLEILHRAIYEAFRGASPGKVQGCGECDGRGFIVDGGLSGDIWQTKCSCCNGRGWHVDATLAQPADADAEGEK